MYMYVVCLPLFRGYDFFQNKTAYRSLLYVV